MQAGEDPGALGEGEHAQAAPPPARTGRRKRGGPGGWVLLLPGAILLAGGAFLGAAGPNLQGLPPALAQAGPFAALAGVVLLALTPLLTSLHRNAARLADLEEATEFLKEQDQAIRTSLADLNSIDVAAKLAQVASGMAPSEIKEALVRADEKISNLTKATRMFSKPLEELSKAVADLSERLEKAERALQEVLSTSQTSAARLEEFAASLPGRTASEAEKTLAPKIRETLEEAMHPRFQKWEEASEGLEEKVRGLEEGIQGLHQEVQGFQEKLQESLEGLRQVVPQEAAVGKEDLERTLSDLETRILQGLQGPVEEMGGKVEELRARLEEVGRKVAEAASSGETRQAGEDPAVAQVLQILQGLEQKVRDLSAGIPAAGSAAPAPEPAHAGTLQSGPAARPQSPAAPAQGGGAPSPGAKPKGGGSVLSAIQKLKRMRGNG